MLRWSACLRPLNSLSMFVRPAFDSSRVYHRKPILDLYSGTRLFRCHDSGVLEPCLGILCGDGFDGLSDGSLCG